MTLTQTHTRGNKSRIQQCHITIVCTKVGEYLIVIIHELTLVISPYIHDYVNFASNHTIFSFFFLWLLSTARLNISLRRENILSKFSPISLAPHYFLSLFPPVFPSSPPLFSQFYETRSFSCLFAYQRYFMFCLPLKG